MLTTQTLTYEDAQKAIAAGIAAATRFRRKMAFAVMDNAGHLIAAMRMDGAHPRILKQAIRKAYTAAVMERNTLSFKRDLEERKGALDQWGDPDLTTLQAGLVVKSDPSPLAIDAIVLGAVGAGGAATEVDEDVARSMVRAMGYEPVRDERLLPPPWAAAPGEKAMKRQVIHMPVPDNIAALGQEPVTAVRLGDHVYTSGVPGIDPKTGLLPEDPVLQFEHAFNNLQHLLERAGVGGPESIGLVNVHIPFREARRYINKSWLDLYPDSSRPARKTNQVPLPDGMMVQLQAVAMIGAKLQSLEIPGLAHRDPLPMGARIGDMVFSSVIGGDDPATGERVPGGARAQMDQAFDNVRALMKQAGGTEAGVNHMWVFLPREFSQQKTMLESYLSMFDVEGDRPARKTIPYDLPEGNEIQIQFIGHLGGKRTNYEAPGIGHHDPIPMGSRVGNVFHSSGVHGIIPNSGDKMPDELEAQIEQTIENIQTLMKQAGGSLDNVALLTVFIRQFGDERLVMDRLKKIFPDWANAPALRFIRYDMPKRMKVQFHVTAVFP